MMEKYFQVGMNAAFSTTSRVFITFWGMLNRCYNYARLPPGARSPAVGLGRAQMVKLHIPHQGVETIQESEEKLGLQPLDAWEWRWKSKAVAEEDEVSILTVCLGGMVRRIEFIAIHIWGG